MIDDIEKHNMLIKPPIIPRVLLGRSSCLPHMTTITPERRTNAPKYSVVESTSPSNRNDSNIVTICPSIKNSTCIFAPKSCNERKNKVSPTAIPMIPLNASTRKSAKLHSVSPPDHMTRQTIIIILKTPLRNVIPA